MPQFANVATVDRDEDEAPESRDEIYTRLREDILSGALRGKLPTRQTLAASRGVSPSTVGRVIRQLREEGLIVTRGGAGTWVARRK